MTGVQTCALPIYLRNRFWRNKTSKINGIKTHCQQAVYIFNFFLSGNKMRPSLHSITGAFYKLYLLHGAKISFVYSLYVPLFNLKTIEKTYRVICKKIRPRKKCGALKILYRYFILLPELVLYKHHFQPL